MERKAKKPSSCYNITSCKKLAKTLNSSPLKKDEEIILALKPYTHELDLSSLLLLEEAYSKEKKYNQQIQVLTLILSQGSKKSIYYFRLAQAQLALNKLPQKTQKQDSPHILPKDHFKLILKRETEAVKNLRKSIELDPNLKPPYLKLIDLFIKRKNPYEALIVTKDMGEKFEKDSFYFGLLCQLYSMRGILQESHENCNKAIRLSPDNPHYYFYKIQTHQKEEREEEKNHISKLFIDWARRFPNNSFVQKEVGQYYFKKNSFSAAHPYLLQSIKLNPNSSSSQLIFAETSFALKLYEEALKAYTKVCQLTQKTPVEFKRAASSLRQKKDQKKWSHKYNFHLQNCLFQKKVDLKIP